MLKTKLIGTGTALVLAGAVGFGPGAVAANAAPVSKAPIAAAQPMQTVQAVTGTLNGADFTGTVSNLTTSVVGGVLMLSGTLSGAGIPGGSTTFTAPLTAAANAACTILTLDLGPLDLDILGLVIELNEINLDITAVPGPGNLLGNLLCAVAGLLDGGPAGALNGIAALLNRLLTGLGL